MIPDNKHRKRGIDVFIYESLGYSYEEEKIIFFIYKQKHSPKVVFVITQSSEICRYNGSRKNTIIG